MLQQQVFQAVARTVMRTLSHRQAICGFGLVLDLLMVVSSWDRRDLQESQDLLAQDLPEPQDKLAQQD